MLLEHLRNISNVGQGLAPAAKTMDSGYGRSKPLPYNILSGYVIHRNILYYFCIPELPDKLQFINHYVRQSKK